MKLHIFDNITDLSEAAADWITAAIEKKLSTGDRFTLALSGGSTPQKLHALLASDAYRERIDWSRLHIFWGDERFVPIDDDRSNAKMAFDILLDAVSVPMEQIHVMRTDIDPSLAAFEYEKILHHYFDDTETSFDLVLLGMGDDAHTLSLFPGSPAVTETESWVTAFFLESQDMFRVTLTSTIVNRASAIAFLTTGKNKAHALHEVLEGNYDPAHYPSQLIKPSNGELHWFVDKEAASALKKTT
jgi:6-phosphogluconolactonase